MTRAAFTASELRAAAIVAKEQGVTLRMERAGTVCEVKPADPDTEKAQTDRLDLMDYKRRK
jgi:hypothetical protein